MAATSEASPIAPRAGTRWLWAVRVTVFLSALFPFLILRGDVLFGLMVFAIGYLLVLIRLHIKPVKGGLAWAVGMGSVGLLLGWRFLSILLSWAGGEGQVRWWVGISVFALSQAALVATAIKTYYTLGREVGDTRKLVGGFAVSTIFLIIAMLPPAAEDPLYGNRPKVLANQASAVGALRTINQSEINYASTYEAGFSPSMAALGPPPGDAQPSASAAGLIDSVLAGGLKSGYRFAYTPGPPDKTGHIKTYTVVARPLEYGKSGKMSFFTDESGVIRKTDDDRPATAKDPPVGA